MSPLQHRPIFWKSFSFAVSSDRAQIASKSPFLAAFWYHLSYPAYETLLPDALQSANREGILTETKPWFHPLLSPHFLSLEQTITPLGASQQPRSSLHWWCDRYRCGVPNHRAWRTGWGRRGIRRRVGRGHWAIGGGERGRGSLRP